MNDFPRFFYYSQTSEAFLERVEFLAKKIMRFEMNINYERTRVHYQGITYPIKFVVFERAQLLGYFHHELYEIGLNKKLMLTANESFLIDVIRRELAHYFAGIFYGNSIQDHGQEFRALCERFGWNESVSKAKANLEIEATKGLLENEEKLLQKIQKLLSLATSSNAHEAKAATLKANELLREHQLRRVTTSTDEVFYMRRVLEGKRVSHKIKCIQSILRSFYVYPILNYFKGGYYLEVTGDLVSVELAEYVANFLDHELDYLWKLCQKENPHLKGQNQQQSFFLGLAKGFKEAQHKISSAANTPGLVLLDERVKYAASVVYQSGLRSTRSVISSTNQEALNLGKEKGHQLQIRQGLQSKAGPTYLSWSTHD